jgi:hypothetical protein
MLKKVAGAALLTLVAGHALANEPNRHPTPIGIYDSLNQFVGTFISPDAFGHDILARRYNHTWYLITYNVNGWLNNAEFFYTSPDCSGQAYFSPTPNHLPLEAFFDGSVLWSIADPPIELAVQSNKFSTSGCNTFGPIVAPVSPAVVLDSTSGGFSPPFTAR